MRHRVSVLAALWVAAGMAFGTVSCVAAESSVQSLKLAFVYNFAKFTTWPTETFSSPASPIQLCVTRSGEDYSTALAALDGKTVQNRSVRTRLASRLEDLAGCHVVFIPESDARDATEYLRAARTGKALTVGDADAFIAQDGMIALVNAGNRIQFDVNLDAVQRAGLRVSAQMLKLARTVQDARSH